MPVQSTHGWTHAHTYTHTHTHTHTHSLSLSHTHTHTHTQTHTRTHTHSHTHVRTHTHTHKHTHTHTHTNTLSPLSMPRVLSHDIFCKTSFAFILWALHNEMCEQFVCQSEIHAASADVPFQNSY